MLLGVAYTKGGSGHGATLLRLFCTVNVKKFALHTRHSLQS